MLVPRRAAGEHAGFTTVSFWEALEAIDAFAGRDRKNAVFYTAYSNFSPEPLPYRWDVQGDSVTITVSYGQLDATFTGSWRETAASRAAGGRTPAPTRP